MNATTAFPYDDFDDDDLNITSTLSTVSYSGRNFALTLRIIYILIGVTGIGGNGLVLFVIYRVPSLRNITNLFIFNQSLIDFVSSIFLLVCFVTPITALPANPILATIVCSLWSSRYLFWGAHKASTTNLLVLTLERYFAVVHPMSYRRQVRRRRAVVVAGLTWVVGYSFQLFWVIAQRVVDGVCQIVWPSKAAQRAFGSLLFITQIIIPVSLMIFIYTSIYLVLTGRCNKVSASGDIHQHQGSSAQPCGPQDAPPRQNYRVAASRNCLKTLLIVCITYFVCWTPNITYLLYYGFGGKLDFSGWAYLPGVCLGFCNMICNPFIYTFKYAKFKKALKKVFSCRVGDKRQEESNPAGPSKSRNTA